MKAVWFARAGGPEVIEVREVEDPRPGPGECLVRVRAAGLNRADLLQRRGLYPPPPGIRPEIPGLELAGEVVELGPGVASVQVGDQVMAIAAGEAQAELAVVHERLLVPVPAGMALRDAGGVMEAFVTAHDALFTLGGLRPGWPVLVHAAGSGVATAAIQLVRAAGGTAIGTSRSAEKLRRVEPLGLEHGLLVDPASPRFADEVRRLTHGRGVPLVLDFMGAGYAAENVAALAQLGRVVVIGTLSGADARFDLGLLMRRRASVIGTVLRPRPLEERIRATRAFASDVLPLLASGKVVPVVEDALPMARAAEGHARMERNETFGKLVLTA